MKFSLTPLNFVSSVLLVGAFYVLLVPQHESLQQLGAGAMFTLAVVSFITDLIFRRLVKEIKRIWIIELVFIIFVTVLMILIKKIWL